MDISFSIVTGLGLRLFLFTQVPAGPLSNKLTAAVLGLWEGTIVHQLSSRALSSSGSLDHILAFGLRLALDLLLSRDAQRMMMILLWSSLSTVAAELVAPHGGLRVRKKSSSSTKERRHRHSRSVPNISNTVPIIAAPLPPRVRAYRPPGEPTPTLPIDPPQSLSTPILSQDPRTPPSFFLQETVVSASPSPKHVILRSIASPTEDLFSPEQQVDVLPARPASGLATTLDAKPDSSPSPMAMLPALLPTPPTTTEGAPPSVSDAQRDNVPARFELYTIIEQSSPENNSGDASRDKTPTPDVEIQEDSGDTDTIPLPVPAPIPVLPHNLHVRRRSSGNAHVDNWLAAQDSNPEPVHDASAIFTTPFSPGMSPAAPIPVLLRTRNQDADFNVEPEDTDEKGQSATPNAEVEEAESEQERRRAMTPTQYDSYVHAAENGLADSINPFRSPARPGQQSQPLHHSPDVGSEFDELRTPVRLHNPPQPFETDNDDDDDDPLRTPKHLRQPIPHDSGYESRLPEDTGQLSPLGLDVRSALAADPDDTFNFPSGPSRVNVPSTSVYLPAAAAPMSSFTGFLRSDEVPEVVAESVMNIPGSLDQNTLLLPPTPRVPIMPSYSSVDEVTSSDNNTQLQSKSTGLLSTRPAASKSKGKGKGKAKAKPTSIFSSAPVAPPVPPAPAIVIAPQPVARSPPPPSPSTIVSDGSELSVFSTKAPTRLWSRADALRREARDCESRRAVLEERRRRAEASGRALEAIQLRTELREIDRQVERLHEKAARRYYVARNLLPSPTKIDVYGLRPREAFDRIDRAIVQAHKDGKRSVTVIVGKGLHSVNQLPTLKPAVLREMQRLGMACIVNPRNEGQLIITLPSPPPGRA